MAYQEFYCDPVNGSNLNGGSDTGAAPSYTSTNGNWDSTNRIFTPTDGSTPANSVTVGQFASVCNDGTSGDGVYLAVVQSVAAGVNGAITMGTSTAGTAPTTSATARTIRVGGAFKGPNGASGFPLSLTSQFINPGHGTPYARWNLKNNAVYNITAAISITSNSTAAIQGMTSTPGDGGKAIIDGGTSGTSYNLFTLTGSIYQVIADLILRNNGGTGSAAGLLDPGNNTIYQRVIVHDVRGRGFDVEAAILEECEAYNCNQSNTANTGAFHLDQTNSIIGSHYLRCNAHDNTTSNTRGFWSDDASDNPSYRDCISANNGSHGMELQNSGPNLALTGCVLYNNGGHGIHLNTNNAQFLIENCHFVKNGTGAGSLYGINVPVNNIVVFVKNCAFYNNKSGQVNSLANSPVFVSGTITCAANPLNDPDNGDFGNNNLPGGGAFCRGGGRGNFTQTSGLSKATTAFPDIGLQHQDQALTGVLLAPYVEVSSVAWR